MSLPACPYRGKEVVLNGHHVCYATSGDKDARTKIGCQASCEAALSAELCPEGWR